MKALSALSCHSSDGDIRARGWRNLCCTLLQQLYDGSIWKCAPLAYLPMQKAEIRLSEEWDPYLFYKPLAPGCSRAALKAKAALEGEAACGMCSAEKRLFELPIPLRMPKNRVSIVTLSSDTMQLRGTLLRNYSAGWFSPNATNCPVMLRPVKRAARLARPAGKGEEDAERMTGELNAILGFVEQLNEVDVSGVEPMTSVTPMEMKKRTGCSSIEVDMGCRHRRQRAGHRREFLPRPKVLE